MRNIGQMLSPAIGRDEVIRAARAQQILRNWEEIVGSSLASRSHPDRYDHGTVWVAVEGSAWAQELRMRKDQILSRLKEQSSDPTLFISLRFGVRPLPIIEDEPIVITPQKRPDQSGLSIKEIAEQRLRNWPDGEGTPE